MYAVCLLSRRLWAQWRTPPGPSAPRSLVQSQNGSKETYWEMGPESLRSETTSECCIFVCLSIRFRHHEAHSALHLFLYRFNHWVDGMALLHQFKISNGQVTYKSRFLSSDSYQTNKEHNRIAISEFGTVTMPDPCKNVFQRFLSRFELLSEYLEDKAVCWCTCYRISNSKLSFPLEPTDNANVSFVTYKGDYYVSTETNFMHKVDPDTLETTEKVPRV